MNKNILTLSIPPKAFYCEGQKCKLEVLLFP